MKIVFFIVFVYGYSILFGQGDASRRKKHKDKQELPKTQNVTSNQKQTSDFAGIIIDENTGEPLIGVTVFLEKEDFQKGAITDLNGKFIFTDLPSGIYKLKLTYVSYEGKEISNIQLEAGKQYQLAFTMKEVGVNVEEVVIQSDLRKESESAALVMQKMNLRLMDIFAGDMILKTTSDLFINTALNRMPGVVFIEDKFLGVRGMPERYNTIMFNGALLPVVNVDRQAFDFSNLPSNMISQIQLVKSCVSDLPATFGGGLVSFETQGIPDNNLTQVNVQTIYNSLTTFKPFILGKQDKNNGFLGYLGSPKPFLPDDFPSSSSIQNLDPNSNELAEIGKKVNSDFLTQTFNAPPSTSLGFTLKRKYQKNENIWGFNFISNFTQQFITQKIDQNILGEFDSTLNYNPVGDSCFYPFHLKHDSYNQIFNFGYKNSKWEIQVKNFYNLNQWHKYVSQEGAFYFEGEWEPYRYYAKRFEKQSMFSNQIHFDYLINEKQKIHFTSFNNWVKFCDPGFYPLNISLNSDNQWHISDSWVPEDRQIYTTYVANLKERMNGFNVSYENKVFEKKQNYITLKAGVFGFTQNRTFDSRKLGLLATLDTANIDVTQIIISENNFVYDPNWIRPGGFFLVDDADLYSGYTGKSQNIAPFFQSTFKVNQWIFYTGVRYENIKNTIYSNGNQQEKVLTHDKRFEDFLPSFIVSYNFNDRNKIKFLACQSIVRPDLRELSKFSFLNLYNNVAWEGNPDAIRSKINSFDIRYEIFNGNLNMVSVTLFYKYIHKPLEQVLSQGETVYLNTYTLKNAEYANNYGFELEVRQKLSYENYFQNFAIYGNIMLQTSNVKDDRTGITSRPLQGQSPYVINTGILFKEPKTNITFDLFYNRFGRQTVIIGVPGKFNNLYVLPRHRIDFQIGKSFKEKFMLKLAFQDLLAQPFYKVQFQKDEKTGKLQDATLVSKTQVGRLVTLALQYRF